MRLAGIDFAEPIFQLMYGQTLCFAPGRHGKATGPIVPDAFCPLILALFGIGHLADLLDLRYAYDLMAGVGFTGGLGLTLTA
ncbi:hypothetical protein BSK60_32050 [Paenibacillus odorifer]|nr:hypothetical protein BSK60_32050 [Paenibacillus odorifer]